MRCYVCVPVWGWEQMVEDSSILTLLPSFYKPHRGQPGFSSQDTTNSTKGGGGGGCIVFKINER